MRDKSTRDDKLATAITGAQRSLQALTMFNNGKQGRTFGLAAEAACRKGLEALQELAGGGGDGE